MRLGVVAGAVWCPAHPKDVFIVEVGEVGSGGIHLRVEPCRSRQTNGLRWAADYTLEAWLAR
jgi:hypothetical protein